MKTLRLILAALLLSVATPGCALFAPPELPATHATFQTLATVKATATAAMRTWAVHVADERERIAGLPPAEKLGPNRELLLQEGKVQMAFEDYKAVFLAAEAPFRAAIAAGTDPVAPATVRSALAALLTLVNQFTANR
jgi:hypothetical protein